MSSTSLIAAIDLGGTNMQLGLVGPDGTIVARLKKKTRAEEGLDAVLKRIVKGVRDLADQRGVDPGDLAALGIGAPGAIHPEKGVVLNAVNLGWVDVPLARILSDELRLPVVLDNDANAAIVGEHRAGAARGAQDVIGIWVGTGIGGGIILNNRLHYGHLKTAGEIGHTILLPGGMPADRTLEHNCSRTAVVSQITQLIQTNHKSIVEEMVGGDLSGIRSSVIAKAYDKGDDVTRRVVDRAADLLGVAVANVVTLLSLDRVVLGGGLTEALGQPYVDRVARAMQRDVFPARLRKVPVVATALKDDAGVVGAAFLAMERL
jgi:glucokinase